MPNKDCLHAWMDDESWYPAMLCQCPACCNKPERRSYENLSTEGSALWKEMVATCPVDQEDP